MRYGIISDVHANLPALQAVLADAERHGAETMLHLGDLVGYGPNPNEVVALLHGITGIIGNHDAMALGILMLTGYNASAQASALWTQDTITDTTRAYLEALPSIANIADDQLPFTIVHGSPEAPETFRYILNDAAALRAMKHVSSQVCFVGHSHYPAAFERPANSQHILTSVHGLETGQPDTLVINDGSQYIINVGSVGQPRDANPHACYALFDTSTRAVTWQRAPYDVAAVQTAIRRAGLPERNAVRLGDGR